MINVLINLIKEDKQVSKYTYFIYSNSMCICPVNSYNSEIGINRYENDHGSSTIVGISYWYRIIKDIYAFDSINIIISDKFIKLIIDQIINDEYQNYELVINDKGICKK